MSELEIRTRNDRTSFLPGEELAGEVTWQTDSEPGPIELRLFWHTAGKGTQDVELVEKISFSNPSRDDRREFRFVLPNSPYSFSGKLISIVWALELVLLYSGDTERLEIVISPDRSEVAVTADIAS
jgi:hypothetical protein